MARPGAGDSYRHVKGFSQFGCGQKRVAIRFGQIATLKADDGRFMSLLAVDHYSVVTAT
jgi:hypothetical protein